MLPPQELPVLAAGDWKEILARVAPSVCRRMAVAGGSFEVLDHVNGDDKTRVRGFTLKFPSSRELFEFVLTASRAAAVHRGRRTYLLALDTKAFELHAGDEYDLARDFDATEIEEEEEPVSIHEDGGGSGLIGVFDSSNHSSSSDGTSGRDSSFEAYSDDVLLLWPS